MPNLCFSLLNKQIYDVLVAFVVTHVPCWWALTSMTCTATTTSRTENLIGHWSKGKKTCCMCGTHSRTSPWHPLQNTNAKFLLTTWVHNRKSLILCVQLNGAHTSSVLAFFANFVECEQDGIITKWSQLPKCIFNWVTFPLLLSSSLLRLRIALRFSCSKHAQVNYRSPSHILVIILLLCRCTNYLFL